MTPLVAEAVANTIFAIAAILLLIIVSDFIAEWLARREDQRREELIERMRRWLK